MSVIIFCVIFGDDYCEKIQNCTALILTSSVKIWLLFHGHGHQSVGGPRPGPHWWFGL